MKEDKEIYETTFTVDSEWGTISPRFNLDGDKQYSSTSGELKYFQKLSCKKPKIHIEVSDYERTKTR